MIPGYPISEYLTSISSSLNGVYSWLFKSIVTVSSTITNVTFYSYIISSKAYDREISSKRCCLSTRSSKVSGSLSSTSSSSSFRNDYYIPSNVGEWHEFTSVHKIYSGIRIKNISVIYYCSI